MDANSTNDLDAINALPSMDAASHHAAGSDHTAFINFNPMAASPDADLSDDERDTMTGRSRDMHRNNGIVAGGNQTLKDNIIGAVLKLVAKPDYVLLGKDIEWQREWSKNTEAQFRSWADSTECDAGRSLTLLGLSLQMLGGTFMNGDGLALPIWKPRKGSKWGTRLHVMESDRLATPIGMERRKGLSGGIQHDSYGAPTNYWIMKNHPGDKWGVYGFAADEWTNVPAFTAQGRKRVIHLHDKERAGASRAKPLIAAVMRELKMANKYTATELETTIANAMIAGSLQSDLDSETVSAMFGGDSKKYDENINGFRGRLKGGNILKVPLGAQLNLHDTGRAHADFDQFMQNVYRFIATGLNIPYELLMKDFSKTNYSSARAAMLEAWRYFHGRRRWLQDYWLNAVYELWLEEAVAHGRVEAPDFYENRYAYTKCRWIMQGRGWVDPVKEAKAAAIRIENGLSTMEIECAEQGLDYEEVLDQQQHEMKMRLDRGLPMPGATTDAEQHFIPDEEEEKQDEEIIDKETKPADKTEEAN